MKIPGQIAFTLPILLISAGIYFSGQYLKKKSDEKLAKVEVQETKIESKTIEKKEDLKPKFSNILLLDNQKGVSSAYKFPSVSRVKVGVAYEMNENKILWTKEANKSVPIASFQLNVLPFLPS